MNISCLKMMITFGNEELLADGREDLPRITDIARPTRLIPENTQKKTFTQKHFGLLVYSMFKL